MTKIISVGMPRTGNQSLQQALDILGYSTHLGCQNLSEILLRDATIEVPFPIAEIDEKYPEAKIILTVRADLSAWKSSCRRMLREKHVGDDWPLFWRLPEEAWFAAYAERLQEVTTRLCRSGRLLVFDGPRQGWEPLCQFLDKRNPAVRYPKADKWGSFEDHVSRSIELASNFRSSLTDDIIETMNGEHSYAIRHLLNNLCSRSGSRYLEIDPLDENSVKAATYFNGNCLADESQLANVVFYNGSPEQFAERLVAHQDKLDKKFVVVIHNGPRANIGKLAESKLWHPKRMWELSSRDLEGEEHWYAKVMVMILESL